jgi:hypothetical protein
MQIWTTARTDKSPFRLVCFFHINGSSLKVKKYFKLSIRSIIERHFEPEMTEDWPEHTREELKVSTLKDPFACSPGACTITLFTTVIYGFS